MLKFEPKLDIFEANAFALVNPVNVVGAMGAGLARQFRERFPENYRIYRMACAAEQFRVGEVLGCYDRGKLILNVPTKHHWQHPSTLPMVRAGISALADYIKTQKIPSVAIPRLGCGLGGLTWEQVSPYLVREFSLPDYKNCVVTLLGPAIGYEEPTE